MKPQLFWPVVGFYGISFKFGEAPEWYTKVFGYPHNGIDIPCPVGTLILATDEGEVTFADDVPDQNGVGLIIKHLWGQSLYWHLSQVSAKVGYRVEKGAGIGLSGKTGFVTGPHLHFAIKVSTDAPQGMRGWSDPVKYLTDTTPVISQPAISERYHRVLPGETLWSIAQRYYGNGAEWPRIFDANREKIGNPNLIRPLQNLLIP